MSYSRSVGRELDVKGWLRSGSPWIWLNAGAIAASVMLVLGLVTLIVFKGLGPFWPAPVHEWSYLLPDGHETRVTGQIHSTENVDSATRRYLVKTGNRELSGKDFRWLLEDRIVSRTTPLSMTVFERTEWGMFFGKLVALQDDAGLIRTNDVWGELSSRLQRVGSIRREITRLESRDLGKISHAMEKLNHERRSLSASGGGASADMLARENQIRNAIAELEGQYQEIESAIRALRADLGRDSVLVLNADKAEVELPFSALIDVWQPNKMTAMQQLNHFLGKFWSFMSEPPREANTEGGVFPAIFGTVLMVLVMTVLVTPVGILAGIFLREYAANGWPVRVFRTVIHNLAGVPSIVYGVFGLGFFVYTIGGGIDRLFFETALPSPTFGTGGLLWASLTMALLTLPVVIISTEEGLSRIPRNLAEGSFALGATQWETLWRTVLPVAAPGILTGLILAVARAAGEVAPLMLVGVVKSAPQLPIDGNPPYLHLDQKFMHLGFHIYDVGFQSPNVEATRPLVFATALLLLGLILILNFSAMTLRARLSEKFRAIEP